MVDPPSNLVPLITWETFANAHAIPLICCVTSALRRGIINQEEARQENQAHYNLRPSFTLAGLGMLMESMLTADRVISFA